MKEKTQTPKYMPHTEKKKTRDLVPRAKEEWGEGEVNRSQREGGGGFK